MSENRPTCRICSCTDKDCSWCIVLHFEGNPCSWVEPDLCSFCFMLAIDDGERARIRGQMALRQAARRSGKVPGFMRLSNHGREMLRVCYRIEAKARRAVG